MNSKLLKLGLILKLLFISKVKAAAFKCLLFTEAVLFSQ